MQDDLPVRPDRVIPGSALDCRTSRSSGPGGQHVNKTETRISLALDLARLEAWPEADRARLLRRLGPRLTTEGRLVIHCDEHRSQLRNLEEARRRLASVIADALHVPKARRPTRPSKGAERRRVDDKKRRGETKRQRSTKGYD